MEVCCLPSAVRVPCIHQSQNEVSGIRVCVILFFLTSMYLIDNYEVCLSLNENFLASASFLVSEHCVIAASHPVSVCGFHNAA